jgi:hypothetical protein
MRRILEYPLLTAAGTHDEGFVRFRKQMKVLSRQRFCGDRSRDRALQHFWRADGAPR